MHPAPSLIAFSTLSGLGLGLLGWLCAGLGPTTGWAGFGAFALGFALALAGLGAASFHLGHPERALLAFTQWRSSWLSREAWLAAAALLVAGGHAALTLAGAGFAPLGWIGAALCLATVIATAMIYASLRTVPRWNHWSVPALFAGYALTGGALLTGHARAGIALLVLLGLAQAVVWHAGDRREARDPTDTASATGLGHLGRVRPFEPPHTGPSYLTDEMAFRVGRRHATKLRAIALGLGMGLPAALLLIPGIVLPAALATLAHFGGTLCQRWLFFAEARHVMASYYR